MPATVTHKGYTPEELKAAFEWAHNRDDWKAPIAVKVPGRAVNITVAAIEFFTATTPSVTMLQPKDADLAIQYLIESEGYRAGPAGP